MRVLMHSKLKIFFWNAVDTNLFRLESTNPKKKIPTPGCFYLVGSQASHQKNKNQIFYIFFCSMLNKKKSIFFSKVFKFTWKMRNVLKRMKNQLADFYFSSYGHLCTQYMVNFQWNFTHNSKNKNHKKNLIRFSFFSVHSELTVPSISIQMWQLLRKGGKGVCISLVGK